jgi:PAP_fibrillin
MDVQQAKLALLEQLLAYKTGSLQGSAVYGELCARIEELVTVAPPLDLAHQASLLTGNWQLLYTNKETFSPLEYLPGVHLGRVFQAIDVPQQQVFNLAELIGPLGTALIGIQAGFTLESATRVIVNFQRTFITTAWNLAGQDVADWMTQLQSNQAFALRLDVKQTGWLEVRYVDETLRIGVGNAGHLFILKKV